MKNQHRIHGQSVKNARSTQSANVPKSLPGRDPLYSAFDELESAIRQAHALYILMDHQVQFPIEGDWNDTIKCGFAELGYATFGRLDRAHESIRAAALRERAKIPA